MKRLITLTCALTFASITFAQDYIKTIFPLQDGKVVYTAVVPVDSTLTAERLYSNAKIWAYSVFRNHNNAIVLDDYMGKILLIEARAPKGFSDRYIHIYNYTFKVTLEFRNNRWRYTIYDFICEYQPKGLSLIPPFSHIETWHPDTEGIYNKKRLAEVNSELYRSYEQLDTYIRNVIADMTKSISTPVEQW